MDAGVTPAEIYNDTREEDIRESKDSINQSTFKRKIRKKSWKKYRARLSAK